MKRVEKISVNFKEEKGFVLLEAIKVELRRLETFCTYWKIINSEEIGYMRQASYTNEFIRLGGVAKALKGIAFFTMTPSEAHAFSLTLWADCTWQEVLDILKSIDSIEID